MERSFSIVIPTHNREELLSICLKSCLNQNYPVQSYEVIVVDDGSTDGTGELVQRLQDENKSIDLTYIQQEHLGVSSSRNNGIKHAKHIYIAFLDDDCFVEKSFLKSINNFLEKSGSEGEVLIQVNLRNPDRGNVYGNLREYIFNSEINYDLSRNKGRYVDILGGVFVGSRKLLRTHLFDETFKTKEDEDLRRRLDNLKIIFGKDIIVYHFPRKNIFEYMEQFFNYGRGEYILLRKWGRKREKKDIALSNYNSLPQLKRVFGLKVYKIKCIIFLSYLAFELGSLSELLRMKFRVDIR